MLPSSKFSGHGMTIYLFTPREIFILYHDCYTQYHATTQYCYSLQLSSCWGKEPSWQGHLSAACHPEALCWCQALAQDSPWLTDPWSDLKTSSQMAVFVLWQLKLDSALCRSATSIHCPHWYWRALEFQGRIRAPRLLTKVESKRQTTDKISRWSKGDNNEQRHK